jgi:hypothetical protein
MSVNRDRSAPEIPVSEIAEALADRVDTLAPALIGEKPSARNGRSLRFFENGELRVWTAGPERGRWFSFKHKVGGDLIDLYQFLHACSKGEAIRWAKETLNIDGAVPRAPAPQRDLAAERKEAEAEDAKRKRAAGFIWRTSRPAAGTPAEAYLRGRGITCALPTSVGYRPIEGEALEKMGLADQHAGPLFAAVFRAVGPDGQTWAVQQVICDPAGDPPAKAKVKNNKRTNGCGLSAAVWLGAPEDEVILAEGPETGLSVWQATGVATLIVLGTYNLAAVQLPERVTTVTIAVDIEEKGRGLAAALDAAASWQKRGKTVRLMLPPLGARSEGDFNDVLQDQGEAPIRAAHAEAVTPVAMAGQATTVVLEDPWDGLAAWRATGLPVKATVDPLNPHWHLTQVTRAILVGRPGHPVDLGDWTPAGEQTLFQVTASQLSLSELRMRGGDRPVADLLRLAAPLGRRLLYGLERLALKPDAPAVVVPTRRALIAAQGLLPDAAVVAWRSDAREVHWLALRGRSVILALPAGADGRARAQAAAGALAEAGIDDVRILVWPICRRDAGGWRQVRAEIPDGYDFADACADGWTARHAGALLDMAAPAARC